MSKIYEKSCAASNSIKSWESIDFHKAECHVKKLQKRIARAWQNNDVDIVVFLQHTLIHSFYAKALAVKIVTSNRGKHTCGIDNILWITPKDKYNAIFELNRRGYKPKPFKPAYIYKSKGSWRKLSIPTMRDRAMQTLYKFALEPISEITADENSYGFRPNRSTRDALIKCYKVLYSLPCPKWILEADIKSCFDNISHEWIMNNIPLDKFVLQKLIGKNNLDKGIPQGGCISTVICNMVLDRLEAELMAYNPDLHYVRYADDFIVIGEDKEILNKSLRLIRMFLSVRGLNLSDEKTFITHINDGFDFLGWNIKSNGDYISVTPSSKNIDSILQKVECIIIEYIEDNRCKVFNRLFSVLTGWLNYHMNLVDVSSICDVKNMIFAILQRYRVDNQFFMFVDTLFCSGNRFPYAHMVSGLSERYNYDEKQSD